MKNLPFICMLFIFSINLNFSQSKVSDINQDILGKKDKIKAIEKEREDFLAPKFDKRGNRIYPNIRNFSVHDVY